MHHLGSGIWSQIRCKTGIIFITTRPATIIRSHCRGLNRITSAPNRAMSNRLAPTAISSMPQHAVANGIGQRLYLRHQLTTGWAMITASFLPLAVLDVARLLGVQLSTALLAGLSCSTLLLAIAGWEVGREGKLTTWERLASAAVAAAFGGVMIVLKMLLK